VDAEYSEALTVMEQAFRRLESCVPPPKNKSLGGRLVLRYEEKNIEQAIVQKLAKEISTLAASRELLNHGFVQEQAALHRILDELGEDILFLAIAITNDSVTEMHSRFLESFYAEEFTDPDDVVGTSQSRHIVPRNKIRAYISRVVGSDDPHRDQTLPSTLSRLYSGYIHGASPQIMDLCWGDSPRFLLFGMSNTPRIDEHRRDAWNYYYRALLDVTTAAKALGDEHLVAQMCEYIPLFQSKTGIDGGFGRDN